MIAMLVIVCRTAIGLLFARSAVAKLRDRAAFADVVATYRLLPERAGGMAATMLIGLETGAAALLLAGVARPAGADVGGAVAALLLALFAAAMAINLHRGRIIPCGCGTDRVVLTPAVCIATATLVLPAAAAAFPVAAPPTLLVAQAALAGALLLLLHDAGRLLIALPARRARVVA